jgi:hypothetical protein
MKYFGCYLMSEYDQINKINDQENGLMGGNSRIKNTMSVLNIPKTK